MMHELQPSDPQVIGPYRLRGRLGAGGMGQVYLGRSAGGRPVAVKVVRAHLATDPEFRERFRREIAVARKVSGVYTSPVIDADVDGPVPWLATAYVEGPSLADAVREHGPLPSRSVLALAAGLAEGLNAIHAAGVVHRDLKPANVLLAEDGPRVIDFGISRAVEASALTHTGLVVGSPGFMSPEQAEGREVGPPSDIFSLGAVLAFAATGQGPFGAGSTPALVYRVVYSPPNLEHLPAEVRPLIERCLAKDPAQRPTAAQLLAEAGAIHPATAWLPAPVTRTAIQVPAAAPPTMTAAILGPTRRQPGLDQPGRRHARRMWRPLAVASISVGLLAGCTFTGVALTSSPGHPAVTRSGQPTTSPTTSSPTPSASPSTSAPVTATPSTSAPATVTPSATPTVTASPTASASPTVTVSPTATPTATVTTVAPTNTPTPISTTATPITPTPVTTTATP
jgi:serine/threonine protein kinase